jgi:SagB-type dehydrogenase family enzyme
MNARGDAPAATPGLDVAALYHERTKHSLRGYARGPETLDWDAQPNPFREFAGSPRLDLDFGASACEADFALSCEPQRVAPAPLNARSLAVLLELSVGLSAWKQYGPDRWALRCNPSSGNLHPTETYLICRSVAGVADGLHHYVSRDHALEHRRADPSLAGAPAQLWIGLSSVHWREAWKYGERAFRYCQLDIGHALGALRYAAAALGWRATALTDVATAELAELMGLDRAEDFHGAEREDAELLIAIDASAQASHQVVAASPASRWSGRANRLDAHPLYRWPIIADVSRASEGRGSDDMAPGRAEPPPRPPRPAVRAAAVILGRRSAQRFDSKFTMSSAVFQTLLDGVAPRRAAPWDVWRFRPRVHPILFVHRVEGLEPGLYALPRDPDAVAALRASLRADFEWRAVEIATARAPLVRLASGDYRALARQLHCGQAIASDGCFAMGLLAEFEPLVSANPWRYRQLHWEAGLVGHALYLEAEAAGLRGTGIGCFFDDDLHALLGLDGKRFQSLYHFTIGRPLLDDRISTEPAYPGRRQEE